jgi:hypothetical protein
MSNSNNNFAVDEIDNTKLNEILSKIINNHSSYTATTENDKALEDIIRGYLILQNSSNTFLIYCNVYAKIQKELVDKLSDPLQFNNIRTQILRNAIVLVQMYKYIENGHRYSPTDVRQKDNKNVSINPLHPLGYTGNGCDDFSSNDRRKLNNIRKVQKLCYAGKKQTNLSIREGIIEKYFNLLNSIPNEVTDKMNELKRSVPYMIFDKDLSTIKFRYQGGETSVSTNILSPIMNLSRKRHCIPNWSKDQWMHFLRSYTFMKAVMLNDYKQQDYEPTEEEKSLWIQMRRIGGNQQQKTLPIVNNQITNQKRRIIKTTKHESDDDDDLFNNDSQSGVKRNLQNNFNEDSDDDGKGGDLCGGSEGGRVGGGEDNVGGDGMKLSQLDDGGDDRGGSSGIGDDNKKESKIVGDNDANKFAGHFNLTTSNPITSIPTTSIPTTFNPGGGGGDGGDSGGGDDEKETTSSNSGGGGDVGGGGGGSDNGGDKGGGGNDDLNNDESKPMDVEEYVSLVCDSQISNDEKELIRGYMQEELLKKLNDEIKDLESKKDKDATDSKKKYREEFIFERLFTYESKDNGVFHICRESILSLRPNKWLNDEIMNWYFNCKSLSKLVEDQDSCILSTYYYSRLMDVNNKKEYTFENVKTWKCFRIKNPLEMKKIYIPVNLGNQHWVLVVIDNPSKTITFYDSLMSEEAFNDNTGEITSKCNRNILDNIMRLLKEYDTNLPDYKYTSVRLPRQEGGEFINFCIYLSCYLNSLTV